MGSRDRSGESKEEVGHNWIAGSVANAAGWSGRTICGGLDGVRGGVELVPIIYDVIQQA